MEDGAPIVFGDLSNNICQECGLPMRVYSYERKNISKDIEKITVKLSCQNLEHKKINEFDFENYRKLIDEYLHKVCKCSLCSAIIQSTKEAPNYCYTCKKIICSNCLNDKHDKNHKNVFKYEDLQNKCLDHCTDNNEITFYCLICKKNMCINCVVENIDHTKAHDVKKIVDLKKDIDKNNDIINLQKNQETIKKKRELLYEQLQNLDNKIYFNDFLLREKNNYFHLFCHNNSSNNNNSNNNNNNVNKKSIQNSDKNNKKIFQSELFLNTPGGDTDTPDNEETDNKNNNEDLKIKNSMNNMDLKNIDVNEINLKINISINDNNLDEIFDIKDNKQELNNMNILYLDENLKYGGKGIITDCQRIERETNGSTILCNDMINFNLLLKELSKKATKSKFAFIVNGSSADKVINFINTSNYRNFFINSCIYTSNLSKYSSVKNKYPDFIELICLDCESIIKYINKTFKKLTVNNERFVNNSIIISFLSYKKRYYPLHKEISIFYCDETKNAFSVNYNLIQDYIAKSNFSNESKKQLLTCFEMFSEVNEKNYEKIIITYLKNNNFSQLLNTLLLQKDMSIIKTIGYFVGKFMYCLVEYGKKMKKGIDSGKTFYKGMELNIIDLLDFVKNGYSIISFPYFLSMASNKNLAEISSKRNMPEKDRNEKGIYSVIMKIDYLYDDGFEPSIFDLKELAPYPDEEENILLPYSFLILKNIKIDSSKLIADIELEVIGKKEILEYKIKKSKEVKYKNKEHIMTA